MVEQKVLVPCGPRRPRCLRKAWGTTIPRPCNCYSKEGAGVEHLVPAADSSMCMGKWGNGMGKWLGLLTRLAWDYVPLDTRYTTPHRPSFSCPSALGCANEEEKAPGAVFPLYQALILQLMACG